MTDPTASADAGVFLRERLGDAVVADRPLD